MWCKVGDKVLVKHGLHRRNIRQNEEVGIGTNDYMRDLAGRIFTILEITDPTLGRVHLLEEPYIWDDSCLEVIQEGQAFELFVQGKINERTYLTLTR